MSSSLISQTFDHTRKENRRKQKLHHEFVKRNSLWKKMVGAKFVA